MKRVIEFHEPEQRKKHRYTFTFRFGPVTGVPDEYHQLRVALLRLPVRHPIAHQSLPLPRKAGEGAVSKPLTVTVGLRPAPASSGSRTIHERKLVELALQGKTSRGPAALLESWTALATFDLDLSLLSRDDPQPLTTDLPLSYTYAGDLRIMVQVTSQPTPSALRDMSRHLPGVTPTLGLPSTASTASSFEVVRTNPGTPAGTTPSTPTASNQPLPRLHRTTSEEARLALTSRAAGASPTSSDASTPFAAGAAGELQQPSSPIREMLSHRDGGLPGLTTESAVLHAARNREEGTATAAAGAPAAVSIPIARPGPPTDERVHDSPRSIQAPPPPPLKLPISPATPSSSVPTTSSAGIAASIPSPVAATQAAAGPQLGLKKISADAAPGFPASRPVEAMPTTSPTEDSAMLGPAGVTGVGNIRRGGNPPPSLREDSWQAPGDLPASVPTETTAASKGVVAPLRMEPGLAAAEELPREKLMEPMVTSSLNKAPVRSDITGAADDVHTRMHLAAAEPMSVTTAAAAMLASRTAGDTLHSVAPPKISSSTTYSPASYDQQPGFEEGVLPHKPTPSPFPSPYEGQQQVLGGDMPDRRSRLGLTTAAEPAGDRDVGRYVSQEGYSPVQKGAFDSNNGISQQPQQGLQGAIDRASFEPQHLPQQQSSGLLGGLDAAEQQQLIQGGGVMSEAQAEQQRLQGAVEKLALSAGNKNIGDVVKDVVTHPVGTATAVATNAAQMIAGTLHPVPGAPHVPLAPAAPHAPTPDPVNTLTGGFADSVRNAAAAPVDSAAAKLMQSPVAGYAVESEAPQEVERDISFGDSQDVGMGPGTNTTITTTTTHVHQERVLPAGNTSPEFNTTAMQQASPAARSLEFDGPMTTRGAVAEASPSNDLNLQPSMEGKGSMGMPSEWGERSPLSTFAGIEQPNEPPPSPALLTLVEGPGEVRGEAGMLPERSAVAGCSGFGSEQQQRQRQQPEGVLLGDHGIDGTAASAEDVSATPAGAFRPRRMDQLRMPTTPYPSLADEMAPYSAGIMQPSAVSSAAERMAPLADDEVSSSGRLAELTPPVTDVGIVGNTAATAAGALLAGAHAVGRLVQGVAGTPTPARDAAGNIASTVPGAYHNVVDASANMTELPVRTAETVVSRAADGTATAADYAAGTAAKGGHLVTDAATGTTQAVAGATAAAAGPVTDAAVAAAELPITATQATIKGVTNTAVNLAELPLEAGKAGVQGTASVIGAVLSAPINAAEFVGKSAVGLMAGAARAPIQITEALVKGTAGATAAVAEAPLEATRAVVTGGTDLAATAVKAPIEATGAVVGGTTELAARGTHAAAGAAGNVAHGAIDTGATVAAAPVKAAAYTTSGVTSAAANLANAPAEVARTGLHTTGKVVGHTAEATVPPATAAARTAAPAAGQAVGNAAQSVAPAVNSAVSTLGAKVADLTERVAAGPPVERELPTEERVYPPMLPHSTQTSTSCYGTPSTAASNFTPAAAAPGVLTPVDDVVAIPAEREYRRMDDFAPASAGHTGLDVPVRENGLANATATAAGALLAGAHAVGRLVQGAAGTPTPVFDAARGVGSNVAGVGAEGARRVAGTAPGAYHNVVDTGANVAELPVRTAETVVSRTADGTAVAADYAAGTAAKGGHLVTDAATGTTQAVAGATAAAARPVANAATTAATLPVTAGQATVKGVTNMAVDAAELPVEATKAGVQGTTSLVGAVLTAPINAAEFVGKTAVGLMAGAARAPIKITEAVVKGTAGAATAVAEAPLEVTRAVVTGGTDLAAAVAKAPIEATGAIIGGTTELAARGTHAGAGAAGNVAHGAIDTGAAVAVAPVKAAAYTASGLTSAAANIVNAPAEVARTGLHTAGRTVGHTADATVPPAWGAAQRGLPGALAVLGAKVADMTNRIAAEPAGDEAFLMAPESPLPRTTQLVGDHHQAPFPMATAPSGIPSLPQRTSSQVPSDVARESLGQVLASLYRMALAPLRVMEELGNAALNGITAASGLTMGMLAGLVYLISDLMNSLWASVSNMTTRLTSATVHTAQRATDVTLETAQRAADVTVGTAQRAADVTLGTAQHAADVTVGTAQRAADVTLGTAQRAKDVTIDTLNNPIPAMQRAAQPVMAAGMMAGDVASSAATAAAQPVVAATNWVRPHVEGFLGRAVQPELPEARHRAILRTQQPVVLPTSRVSRWLPTFMMAPVAAALPYQGALPAAMYETPGSAGDLLGQLQEQEGYDSELSAMVARYNEQLVRLHPPNVIHTLKPEVPRMLHSAKQAVLYEPGVTAQRVAQRAADGLGNAYGATQATAYAAADAAHQKARGFFGTLVYNLQRLAQFALDASATGVAAMYVGANTLGDIAANFLAGVLAMWWIVAKFMLREVDGLVQLGGQVMSGTAQYLADAVEGRRHRRNTPQGVPLVPAASAHLLAPSAQRALLRGRFSHHPPLGLFSPAKYQAAAAGITPATQPSIIKDAPVLTNEPPIPLPVAELTGPTTKSVYPYANQPVKVLPGFAARGLRMLLAPLLPLLRLQLALPILAIASAGAQADWAAWRLRELAAEVVALFGLRHHHDQELRSYDWS